MKNKLAKTTAIIGLALGSGVIGYAANNAFQDLDTIKANFNTVLQYGQTKSQRVSELESQLSINLSSVNVSKGSTVTQGQQIGVIGTTGPSTGIHLHFQFFDEMYPSSNDHFFNPRDYIDF